MAVLYPEVGQETLEATPARLLKFLIAISKYQNIRVRMMRRGYRESHQDHAYVLLRKLGKFYETPALQMHTDPQVKSAMSEINRGDEEALTLIGSALRYRYPEQLEYMRSGLQPSTDEGKASQNIATILARLQALQSGQSPEPTRAKAQEALEAMAEKGLDEVWRDKS